MIPKSLSASSAECYEDCPARWKATYVDERVQELGGGAADLGTACHEALERYVIDYIVNGQFDRPDLKRLLHYYDDAYWKLFSDRLKYDDGVGMLKKWFARQEWDGRTVIATETKEFFELPTSIGPIKVNYIFDREDRIDGDDGFDIDIVDYKTVGQPISNDEMRRRIQPRLYAMAGAIKHKEAQRIWVTYDLLRYEPVSVAFTREDNVATWKYLRKLAERIIADDEAKEKINRNCRWCIRKHKCDALRAHQAAGGPLSITDATEAADRRREVSDAIAALKVVQQDLDDFLLAHCQENDLLEFATDDTLVKVGARGARTIDAERLIAAIGPDIVARMGKPSITNVDALLKSNELTSEQKSAVKQLIRKQFGAPSIQTKAKTEVNA